jgi:hypothetical protein
MMGKKRRLKNITNNWGIDMWSQSWKVEGSAIELALRVEAL